MHDYNSPDNWVFYYSTNLDYIGVGTRGAMGAGAPLVFGLTP